MIKVVKFNGVSVVLGSFFVVDCSVNRPLKW